MSREKNGVERVQRRSLSKLAMVFAFLLVTGMMVGLNPQAAGAQDTQASPDATVRVLHASPGSPAIDVLVNGQAFVKNLAFGSVTDYAPLKAGDYKVQIVPTGQSPDNAVVSKDITVDAGQAYIIAVENPLKDIKAEIYKINLDAVKPGKARVRAIHASPDAGKVDIAITGGDKLFTGLSQGDTSDYKDVDAARYSFDVRGDKDRVLFTATGVEIAEGNVYDIFAIGQVGDKTIALVPMVTSVSRPCAEVLGLKTGTPTDACVRVVHASPGSPAIDIYVNGSPAVSALAFSTATDYIAVPSGDKVKIQITANKAELNNAIVDKEFSLKAGQAYEFVATGELKDIQATEAQINLTPLPKGQVRLRVIHAATDGGNVDVGVKDSSDKLFSDIAFRDVTDYKVLKAGEYTFEVKKAGEKDILLSTKTELKEGITYDVIASGRASDRSLALIVLASQASVRQGGLATPEAAGTVPSAGTVVSQASTPNASGTSETMTSTKQAVEPTPTPAS